MRHKNYIASLFAILISPLFAANAAADEKVVVFPLEAINVEPGVVHASTITIATELESRGYLVANHRVVEQRLKNALDPQPLVASLPESIPEPMAEFEGKKAAPPSPPQPGPEGEAPAPDAPQEPAASQPDPDAFVPEPEKEQPVENDIEKEQPLEYDIEQKIAKGLGCSYYFTGSLLKLGKQMQIHVTMHTQDGKLVASEKMPARTEDDLPIAIPRLIEALLTAKDLEGTRNLSNATRAETQDMPQRFRLEKNFGLTFGQAFGVSNDMRSYTVLAFDVRLEFNDLIAEINAGAGIGNKDFDGSHFLADLGISYYLLHSSISPYLGGGLGLFIGRRVSDDCDSYNEYNSYDDCSESSIVGWNVFPSAGIEFLRQSAIRIHVDFRYLFNWADGSWGHGPIILAGINF